MKLLTLTSACLAMAIAASAGYAQSITFAAPRQISTSAAPGQSAGQVVAGDFNGDGKTDYVVNDVDSSGAAHLKVLLGNGSGAFTVVNVAGAPANIDTILVADVNKDGKDDIITLHGDCDPSFSPTTRVRHRTRLRKRHPQRSRCQDADVDG